MKIYTKNGDRGKTSLLGGKIVSKAHTRIEAYGTIDELNSYLGLIISFDINSTQNRTDFLKEIQNQLFTISSYLALDPDKPTIKLPEFSSSATNNLEIAIDEMDDQLPALTSFILPGGGKEASLVHIARTICRRSERNIVALMEEDEGIINPKILIYLNRLSDYLFVLARKITFETGNPEITWNP